MGERARVVRRGGRLWTVRRVPRAEAVEADFRFWYEGLTAEERVEAVEAALESCLKTRGADGVPRLRRVHRRVECPWRPLPRRRRARRRLPRQTARHEGPRRLRRTDAMGIQRGDELFVIA